MLRYITHSINKLTIITSGNNINFKVTLCTLNMILLQIHFITGLGGAEILPFEAQGSLYDVAGSPTDPLFVLHHIMLDCVLQEWIKYHPNTVYPVSPLIRDGHRIDDYLRTFFPLVTNEEVFTDSEELGVYCKLPNIGLTEPIGMWAGGFTN